MFRRAARFALIGIVIFLLTMCYLAEALFCVEAELAYGLEENLLTSMVFGFGGLVLGALLLLRVEYE